MCAERVISKYIEATERLSKDDFEVDIPVTDDEVGRLGFALRNLSQVLEMRYRELEKLTAITCSINSGLLLEEILDNVYRDFRDVIPYNRIGFSLLEENGTILRAHWAKSDQSDLLIGAGYHASMKGSSLEKIIETGEPRIINDLHEYLNKKPDSDATKLIVEEGARSSLTCPLIANGIPVGFLFFTSSEPYTYANAHVDLFQRIAAQLSLILEKGRLVTKLLDQKAEIQRQNNELRKLNELKNQFVGMAAHDLRGPLARMYSATELLIDPEYALEGEERIEFLKLLQRQSSQMLELIEDLLDVTQIESGKLELKHEELNMADEITHVLNEHRRHAERKKITLSSVAEGSVTLWADPKRMRQVIDNLVSNAVKYSPPETRVEVRVQESDGGTRFSICDQGPGLTDEDKEVIFQDFQRLSAKPTGDEKSTGLGLAIVRRIVTAHGGRIGVDSEVGHGATFWFEIPHR